MAAFEPSSPRPWSCWARAPLYQVHSLTATARCGRTGRCSTGWPGCAPDGRRARLLDVGSGQADAVRRGLALTVDGAPLFTSVQSTWNLLEPSAEARSPRPPPRGPGRGPGGASPTAADRRRTPADSPLAAAARERGVGVDCRLALAAAGSPSPGADRSCLSGAVTVRAAPHDDEPRPAAGVRPARAR